MQNLSKIIIISFLILGCTPGSKKDEARKIYYFDLKSYFQNLTDSLNDKQQIIQKTVSKNGVKEEKNIRITDWKNEFALFIDADINKSAWKDSYTKDSTTSKIAYRAKYEDLKTRSIHIILNNGKPKEIIIKTRVDNLLYHSEETLIYRNEILYQIKKHQKVILLGLNDYLIEGKFKK
ncbi:hypothetical protein A5893_03440 [Pedobacter psychrophilus]|uniref:Uncharacterized protein n=1 Tax=Pedobacter psychrophilus TaxID=1826909 RepID=A0A179DNT3_9SPHI|nr:hypothetical protein [Pedobacter psychrophilus]OAQ42183.1 hypothetical protein A5893_03440 [Pedobacter psychrophilus]